MYAKTTYPFIKAAFNIHHADTIYTCGSCFAEELSNRLETFQFSIHRHPFGIVYNPISICHQINQILQGNSYLEDDLIYYEGLYHSLNHHGSYSQANKENLLIQLNNDLKDAKTFLNHCTYLIITLGSSYYYRYHTSGHVISNCHKIPSNQFTKEIASSNEIQTVLSKTIENLLRFNPTLKIILSVSPVRYLKDGFIENQRSKSRLILTCESLYQQFESFSYFPAYEIFIDDLRDYRYVKEDLVHPNPIGIDYIFNYFERSYFNETTFGLVEKIKQYHQLAKHRVLHKASDAYEKYIKKIEQLYTEIKTEFPEFK